MKKAFIAILTAITLLSTPVSAIQHQVGGWTITEDSAITKEVQAVFDKAVEGLVDASYEPLELLATQVVAGKNYCFLGRITPEGQDSSPGYAYVYIYEDLNGKAEIIGIKVIELGTILFAEENSTVEENSSTEENTTEDTYTDEIEKALDLIREAWQDRADKYPVLMPKPYVNVKNTRIIKIAEDPKSEETDNKPLEILTDVDYIIDFMMLTNYYGDSYPINVEKWDQVIVKQDGSMEAYDGDLLNRISKSTGIIDFTGIIDEIIDLGDAYSGELFG